MVALPPPPVTFPATRLNVFQRERLSTSRLIKSVWRCPFLSEQLSLPCGKPSKPFGFDSGRHEQRLSAPSAHERCVTASVPPPGVGRNARKQSRLCMQLYTPFFRGQVESTLSKRPFFQTADPTSCGKVRVAIVDKSVEIISVPLITEARLPGKRSVGKASVENSVAAGPAGAEKGGK